MLFAGKLMLEAGGRWLGVRDDGLLALVDASAGAARIFIAYDRGDGTIVLQNALASWINLVASQAPNAWYPVLYSARSGSYPIPLRASEFDFRAKRARLVFPREDTGGLVGLLIAGGLNPYCKCQFDVGTSDAYGAVFALQVLTPGIAEISATKAGARCDFGQVGQAKVQLSGLTIEGVNFTEATFEAANLSGSTLSGCTCNRAVFSRAALNNASFANSWLDGATFNGCDLTQGTVLPAPPLADSPDQRVSFRDAIIDVAVLQNDWSNLDLTGADLRQVNAANVAGLAARNTIFPPIDLSNLDLEGADFSHASMPAPKFLRAHLKNAMFRSARLEAALFTESDLSGARFDPEAVGGVREPTRLRRAIFSNADLTDADLTEAELAGAALTGATMIRTILVGARFWEEGEAGARLTFVYLEDPRFDDADCRDASFAYATFLLSGGRAAPPLAAASFEGADFGNAYLPGVDFSGANLRGASFLGACLVGAGFAEADLTDASLAGAAVQGARFRAARLDRADLTNAAVAFIQDAIPTRYCDADHELYPTPPDSLDVLYDPTTDLDSDTLADTTLCPNGLSFYENKQLGIPIDKMLYSPNAPQSWFATQCGP